MKCSGLLSLLALGLLASCSYNKDKNTAARQGIDPAPQVQAAPQIESSFGTANPVAAKASDDASSADLAVDKAHVVIQKSALGKEFLLSVNLLAQTPTPAFSSLQSRVVSFILRDDKVYLLDVTKNNVVGKDNIPQNLLIASFPVLNSTETSLEIDFNAGMSQIYEAGDMSASDPGAEAEYKLDPVPVTASYLDEVTLKDGALFIRQVAQVVREKGVEPVEARYQIKPYLPDPEFKPVISPGLTKVGYFEANPLMLPDGSTRIYAMKWNEKKTVHFAISANTPEKYRDLIKSALLYWNKILGDQALDVTQLEDKSITAPHFDMNIIQWVDYDGSGAAFADAHVDPRSGEVTSAQIFFPSAFVSGVTSKRLRLIQESRPVMGLKGFRTARLCDRDLSQTFAAREMGIDIPAEAQDKAVRDYVYEVVAHELGHVFGLRHNFAASLAANYDFKDRKALILKYYQEGKAPEGIIPSSSVMEYSRFEESAFNGDNFRKGGPALAYDIMAMNYLYKGTPLPDENRPFFCTDDDNASFADCSTNDAGRSTISASSGAYRYNLNSLAARLLNTYITLSKIADEPGVGLIPVAEVALNAATIVKTYGVEIAKTASVMKDNAHFVAVQSKFRPIRIQQKAEILKAEKDYVQAEITRLGGLEEVLPALPEDFEAQLNTRFAELLEDPVYNSGSLRDGSRYGFSDDEKQIMKVQVALVAGQLKEQLTLNEIKAVSGENFAFESYGQPAPAADVAWADSDLTYQLPDLLLKRFEKYALSKTADKVTSEVKMKDGTKKPLSLPVYTYPMSIRTAAMGIFANPHKAVDWAYAQKKQAAKELDAEGAPFEEVDKMDLLSLDRVSLQWYLNNKKLDLE